MADAGQGKTAAKARRLTIRVGRGTLSFAAADAQSEHLVAYYPCEVKAGMSMATNLREAFKGAATADDTCRWLAGTWDSALVMTDAPVLMMPAEAFVAAEAATLYGHAFVGSERLTVAHTVLPSLGAVALLGIDRDLSVVVSDRVTDVTFAPVCAPVWSHLYRRCFNGRREKLFAYFHDRKVDVFAFRQSRFRFSNTFDVDNSRDSVYFVLYVWKQLGYDQQSDELHIAGDVPQTAETLALLRRYVHNVYVINAATDFNGSPVTRIPGMPYDLVTLFVKGR